MQEDMLRFPLKFNPKRVVWMRSEGYRAAVAAATVVSVLLSSAAQGQVTEVTVPAGAIVPTLITLPVDALVDPEHSYIKIRADAGVTPTFKIYPDPGSINAGLSISGTTTATIYSTDLATYVADAQLTELKSDIYTVDISHYNDDGMGGPGPGRLGTDSDLVLDNWVLEISHDDATDERTFHFAIGHTDASASKPAMVLDPPRESVDPPNGIDFTKDDSGGDLKLLVNNERVLDAIVRSVGTGDLDFTGSSIPSVGDCADFDFPPLNPVMPSLLSPNSTTTISVRYLPQTPGSVTCNGLTASATGVANETLQLLGSAHELEVVMLLDASGSMKESIGGGKTRWDGAVEAAGEFLTLLDQLQSGSGDYGIITFPDPAEPTEPGVSSKTVTSMRPISTADVNQSKVDLVAIGPNGWTPMGHGIARAIGNSTLGFPGFMSGNTDNVRVVLLLSDGEHNRPVGQQFPAPQDFYSDLQSKNIRVYTVAYGAEGEPDYDPAELEQLSLASGVPASVPMPKEANTTSAYALRKDFRDFLLDIEGMLVSPPFDPKAVIAAGGESRHSASVQSGDAAISFILDWSTWQRDRLSFELLTPDCEIVTPEVAAREPDIDYVSSDRYKIYTVKGAYLREQARQGPWQLRVQADGFSSGTEVYMWNVIKKSNLFLRPAFDKSSYSTGEPIQVAARLTNRGRPQLGATVSVDVARPSNSFNNYIAHNHVTDEEIAGVPDSLFLSTVLAKKAYVLNRQRRIPFDLDYVQTPLLLYDDGTHGDKIPSDGVYTNLFTYTSIPGRYTFSFTATGQDDDAVAFSRQETVDVFVDVPLRPDLVRVTFDYKRPLEPGLIHTDVNLVVTDSFANAIIREPYLDPIEVLVEGAEKTGGLRNNLDGSFTQTIVYSERDEPTVGFSHGEDLLAEKTAVVPAALNYVDRITDFRAGSSGNTQNRYSDPRAALDAPQLNKERGFVSLGVGGSIVVLSGDQVFLDGPGDDLIVFETVEEGSQGVRESYVVEAKLFRTSTFKVLGRVAGGTSSFDFASVGAKEVEEIRIIDQSGRSVNSDGHWIGSPGVDIDAVGLRHVRKRDGRLGYITPFAGWFAFDNQLGIDEAPVYGLRLGALLTSSIGIEAAGSVTPTTDAVAKNGTVIQLGGNILFAPFNLGDKARPLLILGAGLTRFEKLSVEDEALSLDFGLGLIYRLGTRFALRGDVKDFLILESDLADNLTHNIQVSGAVVYRF